jgi:branched-chain amino acid transport system substrate-binding protein
MIKASHGRRLVVRLLGASVFASLAAAVGSAQAQPKEPLRLGVVLSTSGAAAVFGIPERDAINLLAEHINASGGVDGRKIELYHYDDKTNPTEAARGVTQVVTNNKVVAIIGPGTGGGALAAGPVAERLQVPLLAPAGTIVVTDKKNSFYPWMFRIAVNDQVTLRTILTDMAKSGAKRVAVFFQEDAYGKAGADFAQQMQKELGFELVESVSAPFNATDVTAQVTRIRNAKPDAVLLQTAISALAAGYIKAAEQVGLKVPTYGGSGLVQQTFIDAIGKSGEGMRVMSIGNLQYDPTPSETELADIIKKAGRKPTGWMELTGTNGLMTAVAAARSIKGELTGPAMRDAIESACDFKIYNRGRACFSKDDHDGFGQSTLDLTVIRNGEFRSRK